MTSDIRKHVKRTKTDLEVQRSEIKDWSDIFVTDYKNIGFSIVEFTGKDGYHNSKQYSYKNKLRMINEFSGRDDTYISLNGFSSNDDELFKKTHTLRSRSNLKQIRSIVVDLDVYKVKRLKDLPIKQVVKELIQELEGLQATNKLPMPNLLTYSHGIQLFWTFGDGLSPKLANSARFISKMFVKLLKKWGSDSKCIDPARLVRLPYTVNSRNHSKVIPILLKTTSYAYKDILPFANNEKRHTGKDKVVSKFFKKGKSKNYVNSLRCQDIWYLMSHRDDTENCRHSALYIYAFSKDLDLRTSIDKLHDELQVFVNACMPNLPDKDVWYTAKSVVNEVNIYYEALGDREFLPYGKDDGIIKPMKTETIIDSLNITEDEELQMVTLCGNFVKLKHKKDKAEKKRREDGAKPRDFSDLLKAKPKVEFIKGVINNMPHKTHRWIAESLNLSQSQISKYFKKMKQDKYAEIMSLSASELLMRLKEILQSKKLHIFYTGNTKRWSEDDYEVSLIVNLLVTLYSLNDSFIHKSIEQIVSDKIGESIGKLKFQLKHSIISDHEYRNSIFSLNNQRKDMLNQLLAK